MEWGSQKWSLSLWHLVLQSWHLGRLRIYSVYSAANQFLQNLIQRGHNYTAIQKLRTKHIEIITHNIPALKNTLKMEKNVSRSQKIEYGALTTYTL